MIIHQENKLYIPQTVAGDIHAKQIIKNCNETGQSVMREDSTNSIQITIKQHLIVDEEEIMRKYVEGGFKI